MQWLKRKRAYRLRSPFLFPICEALKEVGDVIVIKSLDHWPDLGNDLDLFTNAEGPEVVNVMTKRFKARPDARSWGDRLANKWNFIVPGLPELVEVHVSRLGQTGEQVAITNSLVTRSRRAEFGGLTFRVPAPEDRLIISTLQRMYRHFYIRLCDIADTAQLVDSGAIDYLYLKSLAQSAGLWDGLATYLVTVSGYVQAYRGKELPLPSLVTGRGPLWQRTGLLQAQVSEDSDLSAGCPLLRFRMEKASTKRRIAEHLALKPTAWPCSSCGIGNETYGQR